MLKTWQKRVWQKDGDSLQDSTSAYSEMPGEHNKVSPVFEKGYPDYDAVKAKINKPLDEELRERGLI